MSLLKFQIVISDRYSAEELLEVEHKLMLALSRAADRENRRMGDERVTFIGHRAPERGN